MSFGKARQVTYPLDDHAISRLFGRSGDSSSSGGRGSEHDISEDDSPCLSDLIHGFFLEDDGSSSTESGSSEPESNRADCDRMDTIEKLLQRRGSEVDSYRKLLISHLERALEAFSGSEQSTSVLRLKVVLLLQEIGHNAAICRTRWDCGGSVSAGKYEFIDVVSSGGQRYIVELDLGSEFEIARPTRQYLALMQSLPGVFVGKCEELKMIVKAVGEAAKISLRSRGLSVPPWRKSCFMKNKWFGPYRRTMTPTVAVFPVNAAVKFRLVGFDGSIDGRVVACKR